MFPLKGCTINIARSKAPSAALCWFLLHTSETFKTLPLYSVTWKNWPLIKMKKVLIVWFGCYKIH